MQRVYRTATRLIIILAIGTVALGLINERRGLPAGSLAPLRDLPKALAYLPKSAKNRVQRFWQSALPAPVSGEAKPVRHSASEMQLLLSAIGCEMPEAQRPDPGTGTARPVYAWRDSNGVMNFADVAPLDSAPDRLSLRGGEDEFFVTVNAEDALLPAHTAGEIRAAAKRTYEQWRMWLGSEALVRSHINLRFLGDEAKFRSAYGRPANAEWAPIGFYRVRSNEAVVLYSQAYRAAALATAFHEMSHLITAWHLGPTPPWLNEGIAEYFETMQPQRQTADFTHNTQHLALLRREGPLPLATLTALSIGEWTQRDAPRRYASAWALVAFLLQSDSGQQTLRNVLTHAHANRCEPRYDPSFRLASYPGGLPALEAAWTDWLHTQTAPAANPQA